MKTLLTVYYLVALFVMLALGLWLAIGHPSDAVVRLGAAFGCVAAANMVMGFMKALCDEPSVEVSHES